MEHRCQRCCQLHGFCGGCKSHHHSSGRLFKTPLEKKPAIDSWAALLVAVIFATLLDYAGMVLLHRFIPMDIGSSAEEVFRKIQIGTSCNVALAQGTNEVANAIGPLTVFYFLVKNRRRRRSDAGSYFSPAIWRHWHCRWHQYGRLPCNG